MKSKILFCSALLVILFSYPPAIAWGAWENYNRPKPLMDYVPQETGIYDTAYSQLQESDCRSCHGASLADRHHTLDPPHECTECHPPPEFGVIRDCTTSGCHSWDDVGTNGWHHNTAQSESGNCRACHNPNLIAEYSPPGCFAVGEPNILDIVPTPHTCQNCHWGQSVAAAEDREPTGNFDPGNPAHEDAGHPSTYNHLDEWGVPVGYYEYEKEIPSDMDTHHMGFIGNVSGQCNMCHSCTGLWDDLSWDPCSPELIRACESCHTKETLHAIHAPDISDINGWEAVGFHVPFSNIDETDLEPDTYRLFTVTEVCSGCHSCGFWHGVCQ